MAGGVHDWGGMHGWGMYGCRHAWLGCVAGVGGMCGWGVGMHGWGMVWLGRGACMAGEGIMHGWGGGMHCYSHAHAPPQQLVGKWVWYASYWNAGSFNRKVIYTLNDKNVYIFQMFL